MGRQLVYVRGWTSRSGRHGIPSILRPRHLLEKRGQAIELLAGLVIDDDLAALSGFRSNRDWCSQGLHKELFETQKMGGSGIVMMGGVFADPGTRRRGHARN